MKRLYLSLFLVAVSIPAVAQPIARAGSLDVLHYVFRLTLSDTSDAIDGEATLRVRFLQDGLDAVSLDLIGRATPGADTGMVVTSVTAEGRPVPYTHTHNHLVLRLTTPPRAGTRATYVVRYRGVPADGLIISRNKYGERTFFGDNWPERARHWLPTVDHPSDKATCEFIVVAPNHYQVVGSGLLAEETDLDGGLRLTHWRTTVPMATKVMVVGVARFAVQVVDAYRGTPIQSWVYPQDRDAGFYDYALAERILAFFDGYIGPYPYEKLANVQSKTRYGGMENASNIFYTEGSVSGTRQSEGLMAHEIAHQWFGDSVTEAAWPHLWLSEGFATYFTQLYLAFTYGHDRLVAGMEGAREAVLAYHAAHPHAPLVDTTVTDPNDLLNTNAYQKGAWVLHMLRYVVGDVAFWDGIQAYYRSHRDGNTLSEDFQQAMEDASGQDLTWFFRQWLYQPGQPRYQGAWHYDATARRLTVTLNQVQDGALFTMPVELGLYTAASPAPRIEVVRVDQRTPTFTFSLDAPPTTVVLDPNTWLLMEAEMRQE